VLYRAAAGDPAADRAAVQQAIDLLYSRTEVLKSGAVAGSFGELPAYRTLTQELDRALVRIDEVLAQEAGPRLSSEGLQAIIVELAALEDPLHVLLRDALLQTSRTRDALRDASEAQMTWHRIATVALIVASVGFIGALFWNMHQLRQSGRRLRRLADAVRQSETRLRLIADNLPMLIAYVERDGQVLFLNRTGEQWAGQPAAQIVGSPVSALFEADGADAVATRVVEALAGKAGQLESELVFPDGVRRVVDASFIPDRASDGTVRGCFVVMIDVTGRKEAEALLRQALKMEAVGQLTGGVAHDFNNLLGVVVGNLDLAESGLADRSKELSLIRRALAAAERGAALTQRLLAFSRRQVLRPRAVDVNRLVTEMADTLLPSLGETIDVVACPSRAPCVAYVDPNQLEAALLNLAVNARDAMPAGGRLTIETATLELGPDGPRAGELAQGAYVVIAISDTGEGMSPEVSSRAFEPFFTTKEVGKGSGLGLSMVFGFAKQSGGHAEIESEPGCGTTVRLYVPQVAGSAARREDARGSAVAAESGEGELVLLVEDNRDLLAFSRAALGRLGYRTVEAESAAAALQVLADHPDVALLFTDIVLPGGMNGVKLAEEARRRRPDLKVLFTSGYVAGDFEAGITLPDGGELLVKPFRVAELGRRLEKVLGTR